MMNNNEVLPCPFCGQDAYTDLASCTIFGAWTGHKYAVACSNCEAKAPGSNSFKQAIQLWNNRVTNTVK